jgi:hypothetical protein
MKKEGKPKFKKEQTEPSQNAQPPMAPPPPPPQEDFAPPPAPPPAGEALPEGNAQGKPKGKKGKGEKQGLPCPEGMVPLDDGSCAAPQ